MQRCVRPVQRVHCPVVVGPDEVLGVLDRAQDRLSSRGTDSDRDVTAFDTACDS